MVIPEVEANDVLSERVEEWWAPLEELARREDKLVWLDEELVSPDEELVWLDEELDELEYEDEYEDELDEELEL